MAIINPITPQVVADGQAVELMLVPPVAPIAGTYYLVGDSIFQKEFKSYTETVLLFDGSDYIVQIVNNGSSVSVDGSPFIYSPGSGFIEESNYGVVSNVTPVGGSSGSLTVSETASAVETGVNNSSQIEAIKQELFELNRKGNFCRDLALEAIGISQFFLAVNNTSVEIYVQNKSLTDLLYVRTGTGATQELSVTIAPLGSHTFLGKATEDGMSALTDGATVPFYVRRISLVI